MYDAVIEATVHRTRPVVLTALAGMLAFAPLTLTALWGPMAIVLIGTSKFKHASHPRYGNTKFIPGGMIRATAANPSGEGLLFCDDVRRIDWRERGASFAGEAPREFVEDALDRLLSAMEEEE